MDADNLRRYLEFYQDLGIRTLYRAAAPDRPEPPDPPVGPPAATAKTELPGLAPSGDTLLKIIEDIGDCKRCSLHQGRNKIVFGVGDEHAKLVFVGDAP